MLGGADPDGGFGKYPGLLNGYCNFASNSEWIYYLEFSPFVRKFIWGFALLLVMTINFAAQQYGDYKRVKKMRETTTSEAV